MNIPPDEKLARYIRYGSHFSVATNRVKHEAFLPHKNSEGLSVFRISGLSESQVWVIGREYVQGEGRLIKARADLWASDVYETTLKVIPDEQSHELHANIIPFPKERTLADRKARRAIATRLANASKLVIMPTQ